MGALRIETHQLLDDGIIPNSPLPLLLYPQAVDVSTDDGAIAFERLFHGNGWARSWRDGIYAFRHYHSTAHEVLGIACGSAKVEFGGAEGVVLEVKAGDAVLIPAGVSHYNLGASNDLLVVGAYPPGPDYNLCRDDPTDYAGAVGEVARVPKPETDPLAGVAGGLHKIW